MKTAEEKRKLRREKYLKYYERERARGREYYQEKKDWILSKQRKYVKENPDKTLQDIALLSWMLTQHHKCNQAHRAHYTLR